MLFIVCFMPTYYNAIRPLLSNTLKATTRKMLEALLSSWDLGVKYNWFGVTQKKNKTGISSLTSMKILRGKSTYK